MGREFQYTPQGMADADQYRRSLGMRDGGPMGFRPLGYAGGGSMSSRPAGYQNGGELIMENQQTVRDFKRQLTERPPGELPEYIYTNLTLLEQAAQENPAFGAQLGGVMKQVDFEGYMKELMASSPRDMMMPQPAPATDRGMMPQPAPPSALDNQEVYPGYTNPDYFPPELEVPPVGPSPSGIMTLGRL